MKPNDLLKHIDSIPYISRIVRTLEKSRDSELLDKYPDLKISAALLSKVSLDDFKSCKGISRFSFSDSQIEVIEGNAGYIQFRAVNPKIIYDINRGDTIQLKVNSYSKERDSQEYILYQDDKYYSTCFITYYVYSYNPESNQGNALLAADTGNSNITIVGTNDSLLRKLPLSEIFKRFQPNIEDSYIL